MGGIGWIVTLQFRSVEYQAKNSRHTSGGKGGALEKVQETADEDVKEEFQKTDEPARIKEKPSQVVVNAEESSTFGLLTVPADAYTKGTLSPELVG